MSKNLSNKKLILKHNFYLSNCDLLNKYLLKSIYSVPVLNKIVLYFSIDSLKTPFLQESNLKIKCFLIFYLCFSLLSYINFFKVKTADAGYSLKIVLNDFNDINIFLFTLILENKFKFFRDDLLTFIDEKNNFNYNKSISLHKLAGADSNFFAESDVKISFSFSNFFPLKNKKLTAKNLPLIWVVN